MSSLGGWPSLFTISWAAHATASYGGVSVNIIGREQLLTNKRATGRLQDLADIERLEGRA